MFRNERVLELGFRHLQEQGEEISAPRSDQLIGSKSGDPADLRICTQPAYVALPYGVSIYSWDAPGRAIQAPQPIENGPFTELNVARNPAAAVFGLLQRHCEGSERPIWEVFKDVQGAAIYRLDAPGVRVKDCRADGRLVGGPFELRRERRLARGLGFALGDRERPATGASTGEDGSARDALSTDWRTLDGYFDQAIAAVAVPDSSKRGSIRADWALVGSSPRLEALVVDGSLSPIYMGRPRVRLSDLWRMRDVDGRRARARVVLFLVREGAKDVFSVRRLSGFRDWLRFATAAAGAVGSLSLLISQLFS
jgi:hypothetical protein